MKDTLFVQFYSKWGGATKSVWAISNGFCDTYDLCKSKGDFHWVRHNYNRKKDFVKELVDSCKKEEIPIKKGNVFICATITTHVYQAHLWAQRYPDINFIVGGPSIISRTFLYDKLPKNLKFTNKSVEQYFGVPEFSGKWKLDLPTETTQGDLGVFFTYSLNTKCYWNKCLYCSYDLSITKDRARNKLNFEFKDTINTNKMKKVFLYTPSMSPKLMKEIIPKLPDRDDIFYILFMRSSKYENEALEEILEKRSRGEGPENIIFDVGVEFLGNRMLKYMQKGTTTKNILNTINIINNYKAKLYMSFILGWPNLTNEDVNEVEEFMKNLPKLDRNTFIATRIWKLFSRVRTPLYGNVEKEKDIHIGPFYAGYTIKLSKEQILLNDKVRDMLITLPHMVDHYTPLE